MPAGWLSRGRGNFSRPSRGKTTKDRLQSSGSVEVPAAAASRTHGSGGEATESTSQLLRDLRELVHDLPESIRDSDLVRRLLDHADDLDPSVEPKVYALTAGQVVQMTELFTPAEAKLDPLEQPVVVVRHIPNGPAGPGLYAQREGEGPVFLLDGRSRRRQRSD